MILLIQGYFCQKAEILALQGNWETDLVIRRGIYAYPFAGDINLDEKGRPTGGTLIDPFGTAEVYDIQLTETTLSFTKRYFMIGSRTIRYSLKKTEAGLFEGSYKHETLGGNFVRCIVTEVASDFYSSARI